MSHFRLLDTPFSVIGTVYFNILWDFIVVMPLYGQVTSEL